MPSLFSARPIRLLLPFLLAASLLIAGCTQSPGPPQTTVCPQVLKPVCGTDNKTYDNDCLARQAGVYPKYEGACQPTSASPGVSPTPTAPSSPAPSASPAAVKNGLIALGDFDDSKTTQIFTVSSGGTNRKQLTTGSVPHWMPAWSPDGKKIAYASRPASGKMQIHVMSADGTNQQQLTTGGVNFGPSWSPDGAQIVYAHIEPVRSPGAKIWVMNTDGTSPKPLTTGNSDDTIPTWSPDGKKIAFTSNRETGDKYQIWVMSADGTGLKALTKAYYDADLKADIEQKVPAWSPDGKYIAYWAGVEMGDPRPNLPRDVWVMNSDGTNPKKLVPGDDPAWSPDSQTILYPDVSQQRESKIAVGGVSPDGSNQRELFLTNGDFGRGSWQPVR